MFFSKIFTFCYILGTVYLQTLNNNSSSIINRADLYVNGTRVINYLEEKLGRPIWEEKKYSPEWDYIDELVKWTTILDAKKFKNNELRRSITGAGMKIQDFPLIVQNVVHHFLASPARAACHKNAVKLNQFNESSELTTDGSSVEEKAIKLLIEFKKKNWK